MLYRLTIMLLLTCFHQMHAVILCQQPFQGLSVEFGLSVGGLNALTDLGGSKGPRRNFINDFDPGMMRFSTAIHGVARYKERLALRTSCSYGKVAASDLRIRRDAATGRSSRNLHFSSPVTELQLLLEVSLFRSYWFTMDGINLNSFYLCVGAGYFHFDPRAKLDGRWVRLAPLRLEGQGFDEYPDRQPYRRAIASVPAGLGFRRKYESGMSVGFEILNRWLFTDYLDDVSTTYIDPVLFNRYLPPEKAALATQLWYRGVLSTGPVLNTPRGNSKKNDACFSMELKWSIPI